MYKKLKPRDREKRKLVEDCKKLLQENSIVAEVTGPIKIAKRERERKRLNQEQKIKKKSKTFRLFPRFFEFRGKHRERKLREIHPAEYFERGNRFRRRIRC